MLCQCMLKITSPIVAYSLLSAADEAKGKWILPNRSQDEDINIIIAFGLTADNFFNALPVELICVFIIAFGFTVALL